MTEKDRYEATVESLEISRDRKKTNTKFVARFCLKFEPIGLRISHVRVAQNNEGRIFIELPAVHHAGSWQKCVALSSRLHVAMRQAIMRELREMGIVPDRNDSDASPPESEPLRFDPDDTNEIPLPETILGVSSESV